mmetsp:Transcript_14233/g.57300  ORF Transcript_14233/g.57300 Transcript_14233/m.57300 type:complete len:231 (-) Transcript_14233:928-1620(-)
MVSITVKVGVGLETLSQSGPLRRYSQDLSTQRCKSLGIDRRWDNRREFTISHGDDHGVLIAESESTADVALVIHRKAIRVLIFLESLFTSKPSLLSNNNLPRLLILALPVDDHCTYNSRGSLLLVVSSSPRMVIYMEEVQIRLLFVVRGYGYRHDSTVVIVVGLISHIHYILLNNPPLLTEPKDASLVQSNKDVVIWLEKEIHGSEHNVLRKSLLFKSSWPIAFAQEIHA